MNSKSSLFGVKLDTWGFWLFGEGVSHGMLGFEPLFGQRQNLQFFRNYFGVLEAPALILGNFGKPTFLMQARQKETG